MRLRFLTTALLLVAAPVARAQTVEITPLVGYRIGGALSTTAGTGPAASIGEYEVKDSASFGAHLGFRVAADGEIEVLYSRQNTRLETGGLFTGEPLFDLALETWQAGGNYLFGEKGSRLRPYVGVGLGVTRLLPGPPSLRDETRFCASFAGGVKVWLGRHLGLRLEARGFFTVLESDSDSFCGSGEGCLIHVSGSDIDQGELRTGLVLRF
jgi:hypothetical protein